MGTRTNTFPSVVAFALGLLGITVASCDLADALRDAPCNDDDDCLGDYTCVKTHSQTGTAEATGLCREDGMCSSGEQAGCIAPAEGCGFNFVDVCTTDGQACFCCDARPDDLNRVVNVAADGSSATCETCNEAACESNEEACFVGTARCVASGAGGACGCRLPDSDWADTPCDNDESCGDGFVCTRTLEQEAEPMESLPERQAIEQGFCRPADAPECTARSQPGCRTDSGCVSPLTDVATATGRNYCCQAPSVPENFSAHVYLDDELGTSAACTECPRDCGAEKACTVLEDPSCVVTTGVCGCTPGG